MVFTDRELVLSLPAINCSLTNCKGFLLSMRVSTSLYSGLTVCKMKWQTELHWNKARHFLGWQVWKSRNQVLGPALPASSLNRYMGERKDKPCFHLSVQPTHSSSRDTATQSPLRMLWKGITIYKALCDAGWMQISNSDIPKPSRLAFKALSVFISD